MNTALLAADHYDRGHNRTVAVLEELRKGFINKRSQELMIAVSWDMEQYRRDDARAKIDLLDTLIDDIALFIQRESRS